MVENLGRKVTLILSLLALAVVSYLVGGFRLGLDLQGGTRLVYSLDLEDAKDKGLITEQEYNQPDQLWAEIRQILERRLDPEGVREPVIRTEGTVEGVVRFVIELPGSAAQVRKRIELPLGARLEAGATEQLVVTGDEQTIEGFPKTGGQIEIGGEPLRYGTRVGNRLLKLERNYPVGGLGEAHDEGTPVELVALDPWREKIENLGSMAFFIAASDREDLDARGILTGELEKARQWARDNPDVPIAEYNDQQAKNADPALARLRFFPMRVTEADVEQNVSRADRLRALILEQDENWRFTGADVKGVFPSVDDWGRPAVGFEFKAGPDRRFGKFTEEHEDQQMAIVINDEIATFPNIDEPLPGRGIIRGDFTQKEVADLVTVLRSGSLPLSPKFQGQETVGATLGDDYVNKGLWSMGLGLGLVLIFMLAYYRRLGAFAALSLVFNLVLLGGALAFLQATLTLPGVAGIILTVGMAVDANILIYERIREEALRGRKPLQSAKDGFGNALSTIVDANLTTLITGLILYRFGTGPVRGFATTLCIGIITSMFSALVVTRVLVHLQLERGIESFSMARWIQETSIRFMARAKVAIGLSLVVIVAGVGLYATLDESEKLGIDFLGGMTMSVRLAEPGAVDLVRERVGSIEGVVGQSAEVKPIQASGETGGFKRFRITAKGEALGIETKPAGGAPEAGTEAAAAGEAEDAGNNALNEFRAQVEAALGDLLQRGPLDALQVSEGQASGVLYMARAHPEADVSARLAEVGVGDARVTLEQDFGDERSYRFEGTVGAGRSLQSLESQLLAAFEGAEDSNGVGMTLASPIEEVSAVGAQVVTELRDKAIFAILLSLFASVMYIRVRFAEYSFGLAAVVALTHDVLITLGALALADRFIPFIDTEINLPMIAAFLTIIGYSLNDTIVVFDRVRENLPRMKGTLSEIIDRSINQCLSRTLLTSLTTLISVVLLLIFNAGTGNVLEGFAFALLIGVVVGTYSSMFIASPVLLWLETRREKGPPAAEGAQGSKSKGGDVEAAAGVV